MNKSIEIPDNILELIHAVVLQTVHETEKASERRINYFKTMEKILFSFPKLAQLVEDRERYITVELPERSRDIVRMNGNTDFKSRDDVLEEIRQSRENSFERTLSEVRYIGGVIDLFRERREFAVVRMYYFNEDMDGQFRGDAEPHLSFEEIAEAIGISDRTARNWRNTIIDDMIVCMFGIDGAIAFAK